MDQGTVLTRNPNVAYRIYDGEATVVMPDRAEVKVVNQIGSVVWDKIDGKRTVGQIVESALEQVLADYDVTPEEARRDILAFLGDLREHGMVDPAEVREQEKVS
ncbi:MAG TPA: PqqD family protein [Candidatus Binatia bacterium]|nr:PqqD family protein [Candidatus Binatia bacterium]